MNQLTNKEIAKVFAMYYGHDFIIDRIYYNEDEPKDFKYLVNGTNTQLVFDNKIRGDVKLLLTPLSKISDEDARVVYELANGSFASYGMGVTEYVKVWLSRYMGKYEVRQYLISKGYAVPLWLGIDHWANGKTAIQLNIAIENQLNKTV